MRNLIKVEEAKGVCKNRSNCREVISASARDAMYVCKYAYIIV
jgi:hypothetical protein